MKSLCEVRRRNASASASSIERRRADAVTHSQCVGAARRSPTHSDAVREPAQATTGEQTIVARCRGVEIPSKRPSARCSASEIFANQKIRFYAQIGAFPQVEGVITSCSFRQQTRLTCGYV